MQILAGISIENILIYLYELVYVALSQPRVTPRVNKNILAISLKCYKMLKRSWLSG